MGCICPGYGLRNAQQHAQSKSSTTLMTKCNCGEILNESSIQICDGHRMCKICALRSLSLKFCSICKKDLMHSQQAQIRNKYQSECNICEEMSLHFVSLSCGCEVCIDCEKKYLKKEKCKLGHKLQKEEASMQSNSKLTCEICLDTLEVHEMIKLDCQHFFHLECLMGQINYLISSESAKIGFDGGIRCPQCPELIADYILSNILSLKQNKSLTLILNPEIVECPGCEILFFPMAKRFICSCGASFCIACKRNIDRCVCDKDEDFTLTDEMSCCPGCRTAYFKDEKCDHVKCQTVTCGVEFCFQCSAFRDPTLKHGNHYHRPNCRFYSNFSGVDIYKADCSRCKFFKRLCDRPIKLKNDRRFEEGEI